MGIGVYICHCGSNIAEKVSVEEVRDYAATLPGVTVSRDHKYMCSDPGQELISKDIRESHVDRVVVASCSPRMHEPTFRKTLFRAGVNGYLLEMANLREQCSWCTADPVAATLKAKALVSGAVRRVARHRPLAERYVPVNPNTLVLGGGIAGIETALKIAETGRKVYLVEREPSIGGNMAKLDKTFPTLDCSACILTPKMVAVAQSPNVELLTYSEVEEVSGYIGNFKVRVRKKSRFVDLEKCTGCGKCAGACPVDLPDRFNEELNTRKAVYKYFPQAVPNVFQIEKRGRPPCRAACPAGVNVQGYVALIRQRKFDRALELVREALPFPAVCGRVCFHPCEGQCYRGKIDQPVAIAALKRYIADFEIKMGSAGPFPHPGESSGFRVAVVGSGPAGLSAAYFLRQAGHQVTVFDRETKPGGLLRYGIPEYRLPRPVLDLEIQRILATGVQFMPGVTVGRDVSLQTLRVQGFDAVLVATGALKDQTLGIDGEHLQGVVSALEFLRRANSGDPIRFRGNVIVVGGGNAAVDAARTALRLGASRVEVIYRRSRQEMPASPEEVADAEAEGVSFRTLTNPLRIIGAGGKVRSVELVKMRLLEQLDRSGRRVPAPVEGSGHIIEAHAVIVAIGQVPDLEWLRAEGVKLTDDGRVQADEWLRTGVKGVFAAGDALTGPASVVQAIAAGKKVARSIDAYLRGFELPGEETPQLAPEPATRKVPAAVPRCSVPEESPGERIRGFPEVKKGFDEALAVTEASRCLNCGGCAECMECVPACEAGAVNHFMKDEVLDIEVGSIVVATGYEPFDPSVAPQWGYGRFDNVVTSLEFERLVKASGPTGGRIVLKDGTSPKAVAVMHCIGSRDTNYHEYCSRICCMASLKYAHMVREKTGAEVYSFYIDMRTFGKQYEEFYNRVIQEEGIHFIRGKGAEVVQKEGRLIVRAEDTLLGAYREIPVDMVVLSTAIRARGDAGNVAHLFGMQRTPDGFFMESHAKLEPLKTANEGVYLAGTCQGPKDIPDTVAQGAGAAAEALRNVILGRVAVSPISASIFDELCSGCRICEALCPYRAISFDGSAGVCRVNEVLCKGCGSCAASCPSGASTVAHFDNVQICDEVEGVLAV